MRVGFIGLGNIGLPMCVNVAKKGNETFVYDLATANCDAAVQAGAKLCKDASDVASKSEVILFSLPGPIEVQEVVNTILPVLKPGMTIVDLSTNSVSVVRRLNKMLKEKGIDFLDAPVSGAAVGAEKGTLAVWVAGDETAYKRVEPVLQCFGDKIPYMGPSGNGAIAKLVHNQISMTSMMATVEGFLMGVKAGMAPDALLKAISLGMLGSAPPLGSLHLAMKGGLPAPMFKLKLARKDLMLAGEMSRDYNAPTPLAAAFREVMTQAMAAGWSDRDVTDMFKYQEKVVDVKGTP